MRKLSKEGVEFLVASEGFKLQAYKCSAGVWTIPAGVTYYEDGSKIKEGDIITRDRALTLFKRTLVTYENAVNKLVKSDINQNQYDALVSFVYNLGVGAFTGSTLLKKVNLDPNDIAIKTEFSKWVRASGKVIKGLVTRRNNEIKLYFK